MNISNNKLIISRKILRGDVGRRGTSEESEPDFFN